MIYFHKNNLNLNKNSKNTPVRMKVYRCHQLKNDGFPPNFGILFALAFC